VADTGIGIGDAVEDVEALDEPTPLSGACGRVLLLLVVWMEMLGRRVLDGLLLDEDTGGRDEDEEGAVRSPTTEDPLVEGV